mgnify:CR=1 FL=1|jgi:hypothetical protein
MFLVRTCESADFILLVYDLSENLNAVFYLIKLLFTWFC